MADRPIRPLFTVDAGWMYIFAGLLIIAVATLIPARRDLHELRTQQSELAAKERYAFDRLAAYARFLDEWEQADDALLIRLAGTQLNRRPEGDRPIVLANSSSSAVTDWIEASVEYAQPAPQPWPQSILSRLTAGRGQLWLLAGGALAVFVGLVLTPSGAAPTAGDDMDENVGDDVDGVESVSPMDVRTDARPSSDEPPQWTDDVNGETHNNAHVLADVCEPGSDVDPDIDADDADEPRSAHGDPQVSAVDVPLQQTLWPQDDQSSEQSTGPADGATQETEHGGDDHAPSHEATPPISDAGDAQASDAQLLQLISSSVGTHNASPQHTPVDDDELVDDDDVVVETEASDLSQPDAFAVAEPDSAAAEARQSRNTEDDEDVEDDDADDDEWEDDEWEDDDDEYEYVEDDDDEDAAEDEPEDPTSVKDGDAAADLDDEEDDDEWEWVDDDEPAGDDDDEWEWVEVDDDDDDLFVDGEEDEDWEYEDEDEDDET